MELSVKRLFWGFIVLFVASVVLAWSKTSDTLGNLGRTSLRSIGSPSLSAVLCDVTWTVKSQFQSPVLYLRLENPHNELKLVGIGDGFSTDGSFEGGLQRIGEQHGDENAWEVTYRFQTWVPTRGEYELTWRVEYDSWEMALRDYKPSSKSFQGKPSGKETVPCSDSMLGIPHNRDQWFHGQTWRDHPNRNCQETNLEKRVQVTIIGDSQPTYMCQTFQEMNKDPNLNIDCISIKGTLNDKSENYKRNFQKLGGDILLFNLAGLWESAYGQLDLYEPRFTALLEYATLAKFDKVYYMLTTSVQPIQYTYLYRDRRKWAMTEPRVVEINKIATKMINELCPDRIKILDLHTISYIGENDPKEPGDMRHFGNQTNQVMVDYVMCNIFPRK